MWSPHLVRLLGYPEEFMSTPGFWQEVMHPEDAINGFKEFLRTSGYLAEIRFKKADGEWLPLLTSCKISKRVDSERDAETYQPLQSHPYIFKAVCLVHGLHPVTGAMCICDHVLANSQPKVGDPVQWLGILTDIADLKKAQNEISERLREVSTLKEKAEEAVQIKSRYLANISHELRTPIIGIVGLSDIVIEDLEKFTSSVEISSKVTSDSILANDDCGNEPDRRDQLLKDLFSIRKCASDALVNINDVLEFSKLEAGKLRIQYRPFSVVDCIKESILPVDLLLDHVVFRRISRESWNADDERSIGELEGGPEGGNVRLVVLVDPAVPDVIVGDQVRIRQVLLNLVGNAIKFSNPARSVDSSAVTWMGVESAERSQHSGIGIPEEKIPLLFKAFSQVESDTQRKFGGTGLGLAICKELVGLMGGSISVSSKIGVGSKFSFSIKARRSVEGESTQPSPLGFHRDRSLSHSRRRRPSVSASLSPSLPALSSRQRTVSSISSKSPSFSLNLSEPFASHYADDEKDFSTKHPKIPLSFPLSAVDMEGTSSNTNRPTALPSINAPKPGPGIVNTSIPNPGASPLSFAPPLDIAKSPPSILIDRTTDYMPQRLQGFQTPSPSPSPVTPFRTLQESSTPIPLSRLRVLAAEDNVVVRRVLEKLMSAAAAEVSGSAAQEDMVSLTVVENGLDAVAVSLDPFSKGSVDKMVHLIYMDLQLPGIDGIGAIKKIRSSHLIPPELQPCIISECLILSALYLIIKVWSAKPLDNDSENCKEAGADAIVPKPGDKATMKLILYAGLSALHEAATTRSGEAGGYTQLTDRLAALGGIDRIRDVLNPPFEVIIGKVHQRFGSIVKLAGDSAIATWTLPPDWKERQDQINDVDAVDTERNAREFICKHAILCCLELLELFESYEIGLDLNFGDYQSAGRSGEGEVPQEDVEAKTKAQARVARIGSKSSKSLPEEPASRADTVGSKRSSKGLQPPAQMLKLHIGLGFGEVHHVFVGNLPDKVPERNDFVRRTEYFVAGKALLDAGIMLGKGQAGQLVFLLEHLEGLDFWNTLKKFKDSRSSDVVAVDIQNPYFSRLKDRLCSLLPQYDGVDWNEGLLPQKFTLDRSMFTYVEPSLLKHLQFEEKAEQADSATLADLGSPNSSNFSDNMNQYRTITILFLRLPNICVDCLGTSKQVFADVDFVAKEVIRIVNKHGGTLRQIHADEKALSVLLVWGVEGYSHEKGDHVHAIAAGMELEKVLSARKWCDQRAGVAGDLKSTANFSLAVTMGKAFCGFIGTEARVEGTVLGPCVNLAARIMCNHSCSGRFLCDEVITEACGKLVEFSNEGTMFAKEIKSTKLEDSAREDVVLEGRGDELSLLGEAIDVWMSGEKSMAFIVGKSGFGKTQLAKHFLQTFEQKASVDICFAAARESRNDSNYIYQQVLESLCRQLMKRNLSRVKLEIWRRRLSHSSSRGHSILASPSNATFESKTESKNEENSIVDFLTGLGIPQRNVKKLQANYPSVFECRHSNSAEGEETSGDNDSAAILVTVVMTLLIDVVSSSDLKVILFLDDVQWMDSGSIETTVEIIQRAPNVFVMMTSRPREEYPEKLRLFYDRFSGFPFSKIIIIEKLSQVAIGNLVLAQMKSSHFDAEAVSPPLLKDITEKSQGTLNQTFQKLISEGNPMVIKLLCKYLSTSTMVYTRGRMLTHSLGRSQDGQDFSLPMDASSAVIATLDKMPSNVQVVLRVASVAGQFFSLSELLFCLERLKFQPISATGVIRLLRMAQSQGIVSSFEERNGDESIDFSFHHYLIYQGIYGSILQSRRKELHEIFAEYYEKMYASFTSKTFLPPLLHHLLKLADQDERKIKYVRQAFYAFSDWNGPIEAQMYLSILKELEDKVGNNYLKSTLQQAKDFRYLGLMNIDLGDFISSQRFFFSAFSAMGFKIPSNKLNLIWKICLFTHFVSRSMVLDRVKRPSRSLLVLSKLFPLAFSTAAVRTFVASPKKNKVVPRDAAVEFQQISDAVEEIRALLSITCGFLTLVEPGLELGLLQVVSYFAQYAGAFFSANEQVSMNAQATANGSTSVVCILLGRFSQARKLVKEAMDLYSTHCDLEQVEYSRVGSAVYYGWATMYWATANFQGGLRPMELFVDLMHKAFGSFAGLAHLMKLFYFTSNTLLGNIQITKEDILKDLRDIYKDMPALGYDLKWMLAYNMASIGKLEEGFQIYEQCHQHLEEEQDPNIMRVAVVCTSKLCLELSWLTANIKPKADSRLIEDPFTSADMIVTTIGRLKLPERFQGDVNLLNRGVSKKGVLRLIDSTKCHVRGDASVKDFEFLTEHWRARILVRAVRLVELIEAEKDRRDVFIFLQDSMGPCSTKLASVGMEHEASVLKGEWKAGRSREFIRK
ncbi:hypothetical protein HDU97_000497 [Phlyctochytrium planicorne]|nr:hypothetical protein HDU97_000497 [Phlyctochytrium planicorne]